jgi:hypothetical protein
MCVQRLAPLSGLWLLAAAIGGCPQPDDGGGECSGPADCGDPDPAPCQTCAPLATALCVDGGCVARGDDAVDVTVATLLIDRDIDGVAGLVFAVVAGSSCSAAADLPESVSVLAAGQKTLAGGDLHQDVAFGRVPEGPVTIVARGTAEAAGQGAVLGAGCVDGLTAEPPALVVERLDISP